MKVPPMPLADDPQEPSVGPGVSPQIAENARRVNQAAAKVVLGGGWDAPKIEPVLEEKPPARECVVCHKPLRVSSNGADARDLRLRTEDPGLNFCTPTCAITFAVAALAKES